MKDHISRQEMLADLNAKLEAMNEKQLYNNAKIAQRMISYVESFPSAENLGEKRACWMYGGSDNVFRTEIWCPLCGELAMYPEEEDRPLETPFCPHCGVIMDDHVSYDPSWPYYEMSKRSMNAKKQNAQSK